MVDRVESIAAGHARALFGAEHAYVQPHSGIDANLVAFWAILARRVEEPALRAAGVRHVSDLPGAGWERLRRELHSQRMLGMALDAGGHLTHGFRPNISGKLFEQASYGTDPETGLLDYDAIAAQAREFRPLVLLAGYSAYPGTPNFRVLREIADEVGAVTAAPLLPAGPPRLIGIVHITEDPVSGGEMHGESKTRAGRARAAACPGKRLGRHVSGAAGGPSARCGTR